MVCLLKFEHSSSFHYLCSFPFASHTDELSPNIAHLDASSAVDSPTSEAVDPPVHGRGEFGQALLRGTATRVAKGLPANVEANQVLVLKNRQFLNEKYIYIYIYLETLFSLTDLIKKILMFQIF